MALRLDYQEARPLRDRDERILRWAYGGKVCIIEHTYLAVEWAHIVPFEESARITCFELLRPLRLFPEPGVADSRSYINLIPLGRSLHRLFDQNYWTIFPTEATLTKFILAEEFFWERRCNILRNTRIDPGRPDFYAFASMHRFAVIFNSPLCNNGYDRRGIRHLATEFPDVSLLAAVPPVVLACLQKLYSYPDSAQYERVRTLRSWGTYLLDLWLHAPGQPRPIRPHDLPRERTRPDVLGRRSMDIYHPLRAPFRLIRYYDSE